MPGYALSRTQKTYAPPPRPDAEGCRTIPRCGRFPHIAILLFSLSFLACSKGTPASKEFLAPVAERFPVDGRVDPASVGVLHEGRVEMRAGLGNGAVLRAIRIAWAAKSDDRDLFLALEWDDDTENSFDPRGAPDDFDAVALVFDPGSSGTLPDGADCRRLVMTKYGSIYGDLHLSGSDLADDEIGDGLGKMAYLPESRKYRAEFLVPLAADGKGQDGDIDARTRFDVFLFDHFQLLGATPEGALGCLSGASLPVAGMDSSSWPLLPRGEGGAYDRPDFPAGLGGLIAFVDEGENRNGDIFSFDPSTRTLKKIWSNTGIYVDGLSLSHDRRRLAFYASPSRTDFAAYEIYAMNIDGSGLSKITDNDSLDGHPAWSPDDSKIVFASFREGGIASLVVNDADGLGAEKVLTPPGRNDNDPEWLPDGRILFKTDGFGAAGSPRVKIAVMNADGSGLRRVSGAAESSDHDPVGYGSAALFERFAKGTDYSIDPGSLYSPWDIVSANLDGSGERVLRSDGFVDWLPVGAPGGGCIAYLRTAGYTDARLMDDAGRDLGRLIPGHTRIRYFDWK